jgi:hypothetical protein
LRWRIETYQGVNAEEVGLREFWRFVWARRGELFRFLRWAARMQRVNRG